MHDLLAIKSLYLSIYPSIYLPIHLSNNNLFLSVNLIVKIVIL